jgi:hypothetical protein
MEVIQKYFDHLAQNPERVDSLLIWTLCTVFCWFWLIRYRERLITGLEGDNKLWEGGEQFVWLMQMITPPLVFYFLCFVPDQRIYTLTLVAIIILFTVGGRWLLMYGAMITGKAKIEDVKAEETKQQ